MTTKTLASVIAGKIIAIRNCEESHNDEWLHKYTQAVEKLVADHMPRGSGIDSGTMLDLDASTGEKLLFNTSFHHMDDTGCYDGWTEHTVRVKASLYFGIDISISGPDRNGIKDYLHDVFHTALTAI